MFLRRRERAASEYRRRNIFELYIEEVVEACNRLKGGKLAKDKIKMQLQKIATSRTGGSKPMRRWARRAVVQKGCLIPLSSPTKAWKAKWARHPRSKRQTRQPVRRKAICLALPQRPRPSHRNPPGRRRDGAPEHTAGPRRKSDQMALFGKVPTPNPKGRGGPVHRSRPSQEIADDADETEKTERSGEETCRTCRHRVSAAERSKDPTIAIPIRALSNVAFNDGRA